MYMSVLPVLYLIPVEIRRKQCILGTGVKKIVSHHVVSGNQIWALCKAANTLNH